MTHPVLVAGATGTNGRALLAELTSANIRTRALVRDPNKAAGLASDTVDLVQGDLTDRASLERAFDSVEKAYIVTAIRSDTIELFGNFFESAKRAGVTHLVKFSGLGADSESTSTVIRQHGMSDQLLQESGLAYTILRPNSFHQNMLWQAEQIRRDRKFYLPLRNARQSTIDVRDIAEITKKVLTEPGHDNQIYDLTGPDSLNFHDVAKTIGDVIGKPVEYVPVTQTAAEQAMCESGMPSWDAHVLAEIQDLFATGAYADVLPDAERLLGRRPRTFGQFVGDYAGAFGKAT